MVLHIDTRYKPGQVIHGTFASFIILAVAYGITGTEYRLKNNRTAEITVMNEMDIKLI